MSEIRSRVWIASLAMALLVSACAGNQTASPQTEDAPTGSPPTTDAPSIPDKPDEMTTLRIGGVDPGITPVLAVLEIAAQKGWWEEENLEVEILSGIGGGNIAQALIAGSTDLAIAAPVASLSAAMASEDIKLIGTWYNNNNFVWVTYDEHAELQGATLGYTSAGSAGHFMVQSFADENPELEIEGQAVGGLGDLLAAIEANRITAALNLPPYSYQVLDSGGHVLITGKEMVGDLPTNLVAVREEYAAKNPAALKAFWRVVQRAFQYYIDDPEAAADDLTEIMPLDREYILRSIVGDNVHGFGVDMSPEALQNVGKLLLDQGVVDEPVDWENLIDQQFLPESARADLSEIS